MTHATETLVGDILSFWFADALDSHDAAQARSKVWFRADPLFDRAIEKRFALLPQRARAGAFDSWMAKPASALARLIVLDQFPRNLYRNDAQSFAFDATALAGARAAIAAGFDRQLSALQAVFVYLPLEHAEDIAAQEQSVALFEALCARAPAGQAVQFESFADYARRHRDVIKRFGRFPHRNAVLGRVATLDEIEYLATGGERFGAQPKAP
jgi:uncharacterized protein (DUF924 family)